MRGFLAYVLSYSRGDEDLLGSAVEAIQMQNAQIEEWQLLALNAQRAARDIAIAARVAMEKPECDVREEFDGLITELGDSVARLEERIVE